MFGVNRKRGANSYEGLTLFFSIVSNWLYVITLLSSRIMLEYVYIILAGELTMSVFDDVNKWEKFYL